MPTSLSFPQFAAEATPAKAKSARAMHACSPLARANLGIWSCESDRELPPADDLLAPVASSEVTAQRPFAEFQTILKTQFIFFHLPSYKHAAEAEIEYFGI